MPTYQNVHTGDVHTTDRVHKRLEKSDRWVKLPGKVKPAEEPAEVEG